MWIIEGVSAAGVLAGPLVAVFGAPGAPSA